MRQGPSLQVGRITLRNTTLLLIIGIAGGLIIGFVILNALRPNSPKEPPNTALPIAETPVQRSAPGSGDQDRADHSESTRSSEPEPEIEILPALGESDDLVRKSLLELRIADIEDWLPENDFIRRIATTLSGAESGAVRRKAINFPSPTGQFVAEQRGDEFYLSTDNFGRYGRLVTILESVPPDQAARWFHHFEPLLNQAWEELGRTDDTARSALLHALDTAVKTPDPGRPVRLIRPGVMYKYANPALENLSDVQKLLIRIGPENRRRVKAYVGRLMEQLAAS